VPPGSDQPWLEAIVLIIEYFSSGGKFLPILAAGKISMPMHAELRSKEYFSTNFF